MIGKFESNKDLIQELTSSGAKHIGNIATIITGTVAEVTREIGEWITDAIEMNEAAAAARRDAAAAGDADPSDAAPAAAERPVETEIVTPADPAAPFVDAEVVDTDIDDRR
ncbi:hypothetical protein [Nocardia farcinica]|uniref:hypothetical protein n=1 Tax=Nocardia farcinica TaxID=37329 RepID=UPI001893F5FE|nr:hypothetical protein [Nocardia farcinica]MBF6519293.1 hypothetical protein [Nocardia farcinica]